MVSGRSILIYGPPGSGKTAISKALGEFLNSFGGDIWIPLTIDPGREIRLNHVITVVGRLRPGVTVQSRASVLSLGGMRLQQPYRLDCRAALPWRG